MTTPPTNAGSGALRARGWAKVRAFSEEVRLEQSIFALPIAYATLLLAEGGLPSLADFLWITLAMVGIRNFGMAINRVVDRAIDARNPRTAGRALVSGHIRGWEMALFLGVTVAAFVVAVYNLSPWAQRLWPVAVAMVALYPYAKRFTWASNLALGAVHATVPNGVWIAVTGNLSLESLLLGLGTGAWAAGFDVIYSTSDVDVDRRQGLHSIPARFGVPVALWLAKLLHLVTVTSLAIAGVLLEAGVLYYVGVVAFLLLLVAEHRMVSPRDLTRVGTAFFTMNGIISVVFLAFVAAETLSR